MKVLLLASECHPDWPSLPVVGYNACRSISMQVEAVLATHIRNQSRLSEIGVGRADVAFLDNEYISRPLYKFARWLRGGRQLGYTINTAMQYPPQLAFEWEAWRRFKQRLKKGEFDLVHRVTPMSPTLPSPLAVWCARLGVPFVLGPLNGRLPWPDAFKSERDREKEKFTRFREAYKYLPYIRSTYSKSAAILAAFPHTVRTLPAAAVDRTVDFPEVGYDPAVFYPPLKRTNNGRFTFFTAGRLVPYKCADVLIFAMARSSRFRQCRLIIAGHGPEEARLAGLIRENQLQDCVEMIGRKTQAEVAELMRSSDVFAFPSIRELGAGVVVEAMACGLPSIVVDYGGPGGLIRPGSGLKVPLSGKDGLITAFTAAMEALADHPALREQLAKQALEDVTRLYTWAAKAEKTASVYRWVLKENAVKPDFYA